MARFRGWLDLDLLAREAVEASLAYNKGLIICEDNAMGEAVIRDIERMGGRQVWRWMVDRQGQRTRRFGWKTTDRTKIRAFKNTKAALRDATLKINDPQTIYELSGVSFAAEPGTRNEGRITTQTDRHDDLAMAMAIAVDVLTGFEREDVAGERKSPEVHEGDEKPVVHKSHRWGRGEKKSRNIWDVSSSRERWGGATE